MYFGENAKLVFAIIDEFIAQKEAIEPKLIPERRKPHAFIDLIILGEIVDKFILKPNFDKEKIFDEIADDYNTGDGIARFIDYRKVLEEEKNKYGFQNLRFILKTAQEDKPC